jgi:ubiquinone/menaquinone biosynthesis C-methylase UbiE
MKNMQNSVIKDPMSTFVLMKILESAPSRYDWGIRIITCGRLDKIYDRFTSHIKKGQTVLDLGCGTGALTIRAAQKGAKVRGIDINPQMLRIAQERVDESGLRQNVELREMGVAELRAENAESYDVVMSGLCFSELTEDELVYTLKEVKRILKQGGVLLVADEVKPKSIPNKILGWLVRFPLVIITYLIAQTTTSAVDDLPKKIEATGMLIKSISLNRTASFMELIAMKQRKGTQWIESNSLL